MNEDVEGFVGADTAERTGPDQRADVERVHTEVDDVAAAARLLAIDASLVGITLTEDRAVFRLTERSDYFPRREILRSTDIEFSARVLLIREDLGTFLQQMKDSEVSNVDRSERSCAFESFAWIIEQALSDGLADGEFTFSIRCVIGENRSRHLFLTTGKRIFERVLSLKEVLLGSLREALAPF